MKKRLLLTCLTCTFLITLFAQPGSLDPAFGTGGKVQFDVARSADFLNDIAVAGDGSVLAVGQLDRGDFTGRAACVVRFDGDGQLDVSFGEGGVLVLDDFRQANAVTLQPDGKILVTGQHVFFSTYSTMRLLPDGTPDPDFGFNGVAAHPEISGSESHDVIVLPDGKIAIAGSSASTEGEFLLARFHPDGTLDTDFGAGGVAYSDFNAISGAKAYSLALQPDGKLVAVGQGFAFIVLARFDTAGALDPGFGDGGMVEAEVGEAHALAIQPDGKIVAGGILSAIDTVESRLLRFLPDGSADTGFNPPPVITGLENFAERNYSPNDMLLLPDGKMLLTFFGEFNGKSDMLLMRYLPGGQLDPGFGTAGFVVADLSSVFERGRALALHPDGSIVLGGISNLDFALLKISPDGDIDPGYGGHFNLGQSDEDFARIALQPDGKILFGAMNTGTEIYDRDLIVGRLHADGLLDESFAAGGGVLTSGNGTELRQANDILALPDGKSMIAGNSVSGLVQVSRLLPDGMPDPTFGIDGLVEFAFADQDISASYVSALLRQPDGKILAGGWWTVSGYDYFAVARLNEDGSLDGTFGIGGAVTTFFPDEEARVRALALQSDGKIIAGGYQELPGTNEKFALVRYLPDGSLDLEFGNGGIATFLLGQSCQIFQLAIQPDGKILAVGEVLFPNDFAGVLRLTPQNGLPDPSFGTDGWALNTLGLSLGVATGVAVQPDGKILLSGTTGQTNSALFSLTRLLPDGFADPDFGTDGHAIIDFGTSVNFGQDLLLQPDGQAVMAGVSVDFVGDETQLVFARYLLDLDVGTLDFSPSANGVLVYPNPVAEEATLRFETTAETELSISLCDAQGRVVQVFSDGKNFQAGQYNEPLNFNRKLPAGTYFLQLSNGAQSVTVQVFKK